jgi:glycosyltransferase involved in cell wall biosynthesis
MLLQHFDLEHVETHMACAIGPRGAKTPAYTRFEVIPDLHLRPTNFGPVIFGASKFAMVKNLLATGLATPASLIGLINYVKQHHIDIIHSAEIPRDALCNIFLAKMTGAKSVIHIHTKCASWMRPAVFRAMKQADGIIGVSEFVANSAIAMGCQPERVYHALNSLDASRWDYQTDGNPIRQAFHIPPDALVFAIVGRVGPWKGPELVLKALAQIKDRIPDFRFMVVGEDAPNPLTGSSSYIADLQEKAHELGLSQQVIFTGLRTDIPAILAACDLYTMPALEEGFCLAILEAMAMKKAVVALDSGGPREFVEHGKSGLLSQPDDVEQLAENILMLVNNTNLRQQMGEYARQRVDKYFNPQRLANEVEQIYRLVLESAQASDRRPVANIAQA